MRAQLLDYAGWVIVVNQCQENPSGYSIKRKIGVLSAGKGLAGLAEKEADGISAEIEREDGTVIGLDVQAPAVVCAGNAIATPVLLLKSGIDGRGQVGAHLAAHPIAGVRAVFPEVSCRIISSQYAQCLWHAEYLGLPQPLLARFQYLLALQRRAAAQALQHGSKKWCPSWRLAFPATGKWGTGFAAISGSPGHSEILQF